MELSIAQYFIGAVFILFLLFKLAEEGLFEIIPDSWFKRLLLALPYTMIIALGCIFFAAVYLFQTGSTTNAYIAFLSVFILIPAVVTIWSYSPLGKKLGQENNHDRDTTIAQMTGNAELGGLKGKFGRTISPLRPSGVAEFDDRRVDVITEGLMVSAGEWVKCVDVRAGKVVVRPAEKPPLSDLENADFS